MRLYVMMGTTLAGKTEHGKRLARDLHCAYICSGDIARQLMDDKTKAEFANGKLSPHDSAIRQEIYRLLLEFQSSYPSGVVLDGFPRNAAHVINLITWLEDWVYQTASRLQVVVVRLEVPASVIVARSAMRGRDQFDTPEIVLKRHNVYLDESAPALEYLAKVYGQMVEITLTAEATFESVHQSIVDELADRNLA